jgi:hypothetical protein
MYAIELFETSFTSLAQIALFVDRKSAIVASMTKSLKTVYASPLQPTWD